MFKPFKLAIVMAFLAAPVLGQQKTLVYTCDQAGPFPTLNNAVSAFAVNQDGSLTEIAGSPFLIDAEGGEASGGQSQIIVIGNRLYVSNSTSESVSVFSIDPDTGSLSDISGSPFKLGSGSGNGVGLTATPDGRFLFLSVPFTQSILTVAIRSDGGLSSPISTFPLPGVSSGMVVSPNGRFLVVADPLTVLRIMPDGSLQVVPQQAAIGRPSEISVNFNCAGTTLFVSADVVIPGQRSIQTFNIDPKGRLTLNDSFGPSTAFGFDIISSFFSPSTGRLFASGAQRLTLAAFDVSADGKLAMAAGSPVQISSAELGVDSEAWGLQTNTSGNELFVAINRTLVGAYSIGAAGELSPVPGSPFQARGLVGSLALIQSLAVYPSDACSAHLDRCLQDSSGDIFRFSSASGTYEFSRCGSGVVLAGTGVISNDGQTITLNDKEGDRQIRMSYNLQAMTGKAKITFTSGGATSTTVIKQKIARASCSCGNP